MAKKYDIVAVTALCLEIQIKADDALLEKSGLQKGLSNVVTAEKLAELVAGDILVKTAGSPGYNVAAGVAHRDGAAAVIGKVANDNHGAFVAGRVAEKGIDFTPSVSDRPGAATTCVLIVTTPDKERTFAFIHGAGYHLAPEDIDAAPISQAEITYLDAYLWLSDSGRDAVHRAAEEAKRAGSRVAIALNDANIVARNRDMFLALARSHGDILLGDRREFMALLGTETLEETFEALHALGCTASITAGAKGAYVVSRGEVTHVPAKKVDNIVDTNGAGDAFAAGFMHGLARGKSPADAGHQGAQWASEAIQHIGAEPQNLKPARNTSPKKPQP